MIGGRAQLFFFLFLLVGLVSYQVPREFSGKVFWIMSRKEGAGRVYPDIWGGEL